MELSSPTLPAGPGPPRFHLRWPGHVSKQSQRHIPTTSTANFVSITPRLFTCILVLFIVLLISTFLTTSAAAHVIPRDRGDMTSRLQKRYVVDYEHPHGAPSDPDEQDLSCNVSFVPEVVRVNIKENPILVYNVWCYWVSSKDDVTDIQLIFSIQDPYLARVNTPSSVNHSVADPASSVQSTSYTIMTSSSPLAVTSAALPNAFHLAGNVSIHGDNYGRTNISISVRFICISCSRDLRPEVTTFPIAVIQNQDVVSIAYQAVLGLMIVVYNFGFGCKIKWELVVQIFKRPVAPAIGLCCQFLIMAPLSFGVAKLLGLGDEEGLGLLAIGSAPGGGGSNVFAYLLKADLELSITMSFISTILSLGMTPLWIWSLGRYFMNGQAKINIPIINVFSSLAIVTLPVIVGLLVAKYKPKTAEKISWCLKPFTAIIGVVFIGFGVYVYYPSLVRVDWRTLVACIIVPLFGYCAGALAGKIFRQVRARWITISLETGFQNLALSLMMIQSSLEEPESNIAGVVPICYTFLSASIPSLVFLGQCLVKLRRGEKPWAYSESRDLSPLHRPEDSSETKDDVTSAEKHAENNTEERCIVTSFRHHDSDVTVATPDSKRKENGVMVANGSVGHCGVTSSTPTSLDEQNQNIKSDIIINTISTSWL